MAIGYAGRARAQSKMWEFEVLMRDSGMSCVLRDIAGWLVTFPGVAAGTVCLRVLFCAACGTGS